MRRLSVNVDHVATVRQARLDREPDPVTAALQAEIAGADSITMHLREDRRHIQDRDLEALSTVVKTSINLEMAATEEMQGIALRLKPRMVTIVPEKREELTTEGGLDVVSGAGELKGYVAALKGAGVIVNLFIDPDEAPIKASKEIGADGVELHTGCYCTAFYEEGGGETAGELERLRSGALLAKSLGLEVHAGHGLDYNNITAVAEIREFEEFAIGFGIIGRSIYVGIDRAVREMKELIR